MRFKLGSEITHFDMSTHGPHGLVQNMRRFRVFRQRLINFYNCGVQPTVMRVGFRIGPDAARKLEMGMLLYLLLTAGFFFLMMRFGCGAHVMGQGQHGNHGGEHSRSEEVLNRSTGATSDVVPQPKEHRHG